MGDAGGMGDAAAATADERGAERVFFMRENIDVTRVYEDWSFSSSSAKGLKEVRLVISSVSLELLLDLDSDVWLPEEPTRGEAMLSGSLFMSDE